LLRFLSKQEVVRCPSLSQALNHQLFGRRTELLNS
jgi:hypothetical protein